MLDGFKYLPGFLSAASQSALLADVRAVIEQAPLFVPRMPRTGKPLSVRMTNCGRLGWVTDKERGYRYQPDHPTTGRPWPPIPTSLIGLWATVADCPLAPQACLVNVYAGGARLGSHRDVDEEELSAPVVSISLGDDGIFHIGGLKRSDPKTRITLRSGDVAVLGGKSRLAFHGIDRVLQGTSSLLAEGGRINLTLRRVTRAS